MHNNPVDLTQENDNDGSSESNIAPTIPDQIGITIEPQKKQIIYDLQNKINETEVYFEAIPFWRNWINVFTLVTIVFVFIVSEFLLITLSPDLPNQVPFFYDTTIGSWDLLPKGLLIWVPIIIFVAQSIAFFLTLKLYNFDRRLVTVVNFSLSFIGIIFLIAIGQILSMVLI